MIWFLAIIGIYFLGVVISFIKDRNHYSYSSSDYRNDVIVLAFAWPLMLVLFAFIWFLHIVGFRIH